MRLMPSQVDRPIDGVSKEDEERERHETAVQVLAVGRCWLLASLPGGLAKHSSHVGHHAILPGGMGSSRHAIYVYIYTYTYSRQAVYPSRKICA